LKDLHIPAAYISTPANQEKQSKNLIIKSLQFATNPHLSKEVKKTLRNLIIKFLQFSSSIEQKKNRDKYIY
jgi:hypothetical protein